MGRSELLDIERKLRYMLRLYSDRTTEEGRYDET